MLPKNKIPKNKISITTRVDRTGNPPYPDRSNEKLASKPASKVPSSASNVSSVASKVSSVASSIDKDRQHYNDMISKYLNTLGIETKTEAQIYREELIKIQKIFDGNQNVLGNLLKRAESFIKRETVIDTPENYIILAQTIQELEPLSQSKIITPEQKIIVDDYLSVLKKLIRIHARSFHHPSNNFENTIKALQTASVVKGHLINAAKWLKTIVVNVAIGIKEDYDLLAQNVIEDLFTQDEDVLSEISTISISNISDRIKPDIPDFDPTYKAINKYLIDAPIDQDLEFLNAALLIYKKNHLLIHSKKPDTNNVEFILDLMGIIIKQGEILKSKSNDEITKQHIDDNVAEAIRFFHSQIDRNTEPISRSPSFNEENSMIGPSDSQSSFNSNISGLDTSSVSQRNPGGGKRKKPHKLTRRDKNKGSTRRRQTRKGKPTRRIKHITKKH